MLPGRNSVRSGSLWWLGDGVGAVLVAPVIILWVADFGLHYEVEPPSRDVCHGAGSLILVAEIVFCGLFAAGDQDLSARISLYSVFAVGLASLRTKRSGDRHACFSGHRRMGIPCTGFWPLITPDKNESLLLLQTFMGVVAVMTLA